MDAGLEKVNVFPAKLFLAISAEYIVGSSFVNEYTIAA
jgi:hypothetical protein